MFWQDDPYRQADFIQRRAKVRNEGRVGTGAHGRGIKPPAVNYGRFTRYSRRVFRGGQCLRDDGAGGVKGVRALEVGREAVVEKALGEICALGRHRAGPRLETYVSIRAAVVPVGRAPEWVQEDLKSYVRWLFERQYTPRSVRIHTETLSEFWHRAEAEGVESYESVTTEFIDRHRHALLDTWLCPRCGAASKIDPTAPGAKSRKTQACPGCWSEMRKRCSGDTVRHKVSVLKKFFRWAKKAGRDETDPAASVLNPKGPPNSLTTYPDWVDTKLADYIRRPDAPARHVVVCYLVLYHAFSVEELQSALAPSESAGGDDAVPLSDAYDLELFELEVTKGRHHEGHHGRVEFLREAESFHRPKLAEYGAEREAMLKGRKSRYLIATRNGVRSDSKVSRKTIANIISAAAAAAYQGGASTKLLNKSVRLQLAEDAGARVLKHLGLSGRQAYRTYSGHPKLVRRVVSPKESGSQAAEPTPNEA